MYGDGQHDPADIPRLLIDLLVIGSRLWNREVMPIARYRANRFANFWIAWASGQTVEDSQDSGCIRRNFSGTAGSSPAVNGASFSKAKSSLKPLATDFYAPLCRFRPHTPKMPDSVISAQ